MSERFRLIEHPNGTNMYRIHPAGNSDNDFAFFGFRIFFIFLKELIKREEFNSNITDSLKQEFEKTAESYVQKGNLLDATKVFAITKNKEKLGGNTLLTISQLIVKAAAVSQKMPLFPNRLV